MVGEQGNRTSGPRNTASRSVPNSYWWKRIHNLNARSGVQEVSDGLNCAEKFSSLVSCHRGYGSVAFYAVFSLFILTFLYAIWKIVSAHSRSTRRPGSSNSTSTTKLGPTPHALTGYPAAHPWMTTESITEHFHQNVKKLHPSQNEAPQQRPSSPIYFPSPNNEHEKITSVTNNDDPLIGGNVALRNLLPTLPSPARATKRFNNYYQGAFNSIQPALNYPSEQYPAVFNPILPTVRYPKAYYLYSRPPIPGGVMENQNYPIETKVSRPLPYSSNSVGILNDKPAVSSYPVEPNVSYITPYYFPSNKNSMTRSSFSNGYYGESPFMSNFVGAETTPSPLISFLKGSSSKVSLSPRQSSQTGEGRKKPRRKNRRHKKRKQSRPFRKHSEFEEIQDIEEESNRASSKASSPRHHKIEVERKAGKQTKERYGTRKLGKGRHTGSTIRGVRHRSHILASRRVHTSSEIEVYHTYHGLEKKAQHKRRQDTSNKYRRTNIPHPQITVQTGHSRHSHYQFRKKDHAIHRHSKGLGGHHVTHERHGKILDFKQYHRYRKHHSLSDEIRGKWHISRHRVKTCNVIDTFATRGTVKITRAVGHKKQYLHTLLACRPVRLRVRHRNHQRTFSVKYAQLCSKRWYVTKGVIHIQKTVSNEIEIPRYNVRICDPSYAHAMNLLPTKEKETKVWGLSQEFLRKVEKEDERKFKLSSSSSKRGHKKKKKRVKPWQHSKKKSFRSNKTRNSIKKPREYHKVETKRKIHRHRVHKKSHHLKRKSEKRHGGKKKKHNRKVKGGLEMKKNKLSSKRGEEHVQNPDKLFYGKLLRVLKLARTYERKKENKTNSDDVFDSLEAVLTQNRNVDNNSTRSDNSTSKINHAKENNVTKHNERNGDPAGQPKNRQKDSKVNIQRLLAKVLPAVVAKIINADHDVGESEATEVKTKPTQSTTTEKTTTKKPIPTNKITTPAKNSLGEKSMQDIVKRILPLLLQRAGKKTTKQAQGIKSKHKTKEPSFPPKRTSPKPKKIMVRTSLTNILSKLGIGNLDSNSLSSTILAKTTSFIPKPPLKSKPKSTAVPLKTTVITTIPPQSPYTPLTPTLTTQLPPTLREPDIDRSSFRPTMEQFFPPHENSQISPVGPPSVSQSEPSSVQSPGSLPASSPISFSPRRSDPYSRNILCFGDSLTSGFFNHGRNFHPYSQRLSQLLNSDGRLKYYVKTSGKVREMAHGSMTKRLPQVLGNSSRFDWVIILGGTNDVAHVKNFGDDDSFMTQLINVWQPRITRDIEMLHETAHRYGARTLLLTIPETAYEAWPSFKTLWVMRNRLNEDLRKYALRSQGNVVLCDLAAKFPRHSLPPQTQALLWNDHLHPTAYGYDKMAEIVYQCLKPYLH